MYYIFGLGNPDIKYQSSRHNVGHSTLFWLHENHNFSSWEEKKKQKALVSKGELKGKDVTLVISTEHMNNSGKTAQHFAKNVSQAKKLVVVQDDIDMGLGDVKVLFNRGTGGHNGIYSINRSIKTNAYFRIKIGISLKTKTGKIKKPVGEKKVVDFVLGKFTKTEKDTLCNAYPLVEKAVEMIVSGELAPKKEPFSQVIR